MFDFAHRRRRRFSIRSPRKIHRKKLLSGFFILTLGLVLCIFIGAFIVFAWYARDLPNPGKVQRREGFSTIIYDRNGKVLYDIFEDKNRIPITIDQVPDFLKQATVAVEDKSFYEHQGYSTKGILRAFFSILLKGDLQGGSTLTQQLVKNVLLTSERTLPRKIKEFILAVQIERKYTKDEILQMYLNEAPYGGTAWGVQTGAKQYFGKDVKDLNLVESAFLAGLPQAPSRYSPFTSDEKDYVGRTEHVLKRMREDGYITKDQEKEAKNAISTLTFSDTPVSFEAPHFVMYVKKQLISQFGEDLVEKGGLRVYTTLDLELQKKTEAILSEELNKLKNLDVGNGAVVVLDPNTGQIIAHVGSKSFASDENDYGGEFDVATQGLRQPGSALKPIVYATAFSKNMTPATMLMDVLTEFTPGGEEKPYKPENYDGKYRGPMQLRFALGNSINTIAVKTLAMVGLRDFLQQAYKMGLTTLEPTNENLRRFGLAIALGGGEVKLMDLTQAYGVFAAGGVKQNITPFLKIEDKSGKKIYEYKDRKGEQVLSKDVAFLISHILSDNNARLDVFGPNSWLNIPGKTVAVKTGTTNDKRDNWTFGYTKDAVVGVWVGNNDNSPMNQKLASGVTGAAPIWNRVIKAVLETRGDGFIDKPDTVIALNVDALGGGLPVDGQATRSEYFIQGTEPTDKASIYQKLKISKKDSNKLASNDEVRIGDYDEKDYIVIVEEDPLSNDGINRWQQAIQAFLSSNSDPKFKPPTETSGVTIPTSNPTQTNEEEFTPTPKTDEITLTPSPTPS
jgi:1A family penicillin-binding protein